MYVDLTLGLNEIFIDDEIKDERKNKMLESGHFGTHIDIHLQTEIPLEYMKNRAMMFDVSEIADREVMPEDIDLSSIMAGDCIIFKTDRIKAYYYGTKEYFHEHPQLSEALIDALIDKEIHIIAIDTAGIRRGREHIVADRRCEENGIYVIENIHRLDDLSTAGPFQVYLMWLKLPGKTGLPCRIVAEIM